MYTLDSLTKMTIKQLQPIATELGIKGKLNKASLIQEIITVANIAYGNPSLRYDDMLPNEEDQKIEKKDINVSADLTVNDFSTYADSFDIFGLNTSNLAQHTVTEQQIVPVTTTKELPASSVTVT